MTTKQTEETSKAKQQELVKQMTEQYRAKMGITTATETKTTTRKTRGKVSKEEVHERIQKGTFEDIQNAGNAVGKTVIEAVKAVNQEAVSIGGFLTNLTKFSETEQQRLDAGDQTVIIAEQALATANAIPNTGWQRFWGRATKIKDAELALENAKTANAKVKKDVEEAKDIRINNADNDEAVDTYIAQCQALIIVLAEVIKNNLADSEKLKAENEDAQKNFVEQTAKITLLKETMADIESRLETAIRERADFVPETKESAEHETSINDIQKEYNTQKMMLDEAMTLRNEAEASSLQTIGQLTSLDQTAGMITAIRSGLEASTKTREITFRAALTLMKASAAYKIASGTTEAGRAVDKMILENAALTLGIFFKDSGKRLLEHPENAQDMREMLQLIAQLMAESKETIDAFDEMQKKNYNESLPGDNKLPGSNGQEN